jgi:hypothetical protein
MKPTMAGIFDFNIIKSIGHSAKKIRLLTQTDSLKFKSKVESQKSKVKSETSKFNFLKSIDGLLRHTHQQPLPSQPRSSLGVGGLL